MSKIIGAGGGNIAIGAGDLSCRLGGPFIISCHIYNKQEKQYLGHNTPLLYMVECEACPEWILYICNSIYGIE